MTQSPEPIINEEIIAEEVQVRRFERRDARQEFTSNGTIAAAVMVLAAILAVIVANTPAYELVHHFFETPIGVSLGGVSASLTLEEFVNDFLMAIFFLLVGIELKYEMTVGQLRRPRQAALPMLAAVGGVAVPSLIYIALNLGRGGAPHGWAVPMATDIAFALGIMSLLGDRVKPATKVFFSTLAIADDILAIIVIAVFYGQTPSIPWLAAHMPLAGTSSWALSCGYVCSTLVSTRRSPVSSWPCSCLPSLISVLTRCMIGWAIRQLSSTMSMTRSPTSLASTISRRRLVASSALCIV